MERHNNYQKIIILGLFVILFIFGYLYWSERTGGIGFPLDDAWIHQVFARNLAYTGQWAFEIDEPSAGSTSPLWSALISLGYIFNLSPFILPFMLGGASLFVLGMMAEDIYHRVVPGKKVLIPLIGMFIIGEWHLVWAAVSGMEILLFCVLVLSVFRIFLVLEVNAFNSQLLRYLIAGFFVGISIWLRPEGITLIAPAFLILLFIPIKFKQKLISLLILLIGFLCAFLPFVMFNIQLSGNWMPNTYYAKQAEYAIILNEPILQRLYTQIRAPMIGGGIFLLPGVVYFGWWALWKRRLFGVAALLWWIGFVVLYAVRLPVAYQHGRYQIPGMVIYFMLGVIGIGLIINEWKTKTGTHIRVLKKIWIYSIGGVWVMFLVLGGNAYSHDVTFINSEMVAASKWIASNTEQDAVIATHDIGALGYFGGRKIIDLAGLVSPEVVTFIRDENRLKIYLDDENVNYLLTFPSWYPYLVVYGESVYSTSGKIAHDLGSENMVVYRWR